jgi:hypothetical protein
MKNLVLSLMFISTSLLASSEGLDEDLLASYEITGHSRACCNFGPDYLLRAAGLAGVIDKEFMGDHHFARAYKNNDQVGIIYTCKAGFVDISHLRDNADWAGHIYFNLPQWLGSDQEITARREGGFHRRAVYFPKLTQQELKSLTPKDYQKLAIAIGFDMALLHEISTAYYIPVSSPGSVVNTERMSSFSVEDAYSNLLGSYLGVEAAMSTKPFNESMTEQLNSTLEQLEAQPYMNTWTAYNLVRGSWWKPGLAGGFKHVLKRNFTYEGDVQPAIVPGTFFCPEKVESSPLEIPEFLSNGKSVNHYYSIRGLFNNRLERGMKKMNLQVDTVITQDSYPMIIDAVKKKFMKKLGKEIIEF